MLSLKYVRVASLYAIFFFTEALPWEKYVFYFPLLVLLSKKLVKGLLVIFCCMFCIFRFLIRNENAELVHVFFVYFVGFAVLFIFVTEVMYLWMNT